MGHDTTSPIVDPSHLCRRATPSRTGSSDSSVSRDEQAGLRRKLRGLRGKTGALARSGSDESDSYSPKNSERSLQDRDDKMGSSRSLKTQESTASTACSYGSQSFACDSYCGPQGNLKEASVASLSSADAGPRARTSGRGLSRRGAGRGIMTQTQTPSSSSMASSKTSLADVSEHSTTSLLSSASALSSTSSTTMGLSRAGTRGRTRGLGNKKVSTLRVTEPTLSPMVSSSGAVSPMVGKRVSSTLPSSLERRSFAAIPRPGMPDNSKDDKMNRSCLSGVTASSQHSQSSLMSISEDSRSTLRGSILSTTSSLLGGHGLRARREPSVNSRQMDHSSADTSEPSVLTAAVEVAPQTPPPAAVVAPAPAAATRTPPAVVMEAQELASSKYQPTQEDWAALYNKHVEVLERKDLEIAMKLSTMPTGLYDNQRSDGDDDGDDASMDGIQLALEVSRRETQQPSGNSAEEDRMLQMVLEMSRNDELESSFANASFSSNMNNAAPSGLLQASTSIMGSQVNHDEDATNEDLLEACPSQSADPDAELERALQVSQQQPERALSEEEELERVLRMSEQEAQQQPVSEDEELERVLKLSQLQHEQQQNSDSNGDDEELLRVLQMSQQEATDQQKERETMELVLRLSQQGSDGGVW